RQPRPRIAGPGVEVVAADIQHRGPGEAKVGAKRRVGKRDEALAGAGPDFERGGNRDAGQGANEVAGCEHEGSQRRRGAGREALASGPGQPVPEAVGTSFWQRPAASGEDDAPGAQVAPFAADVEPLRFGTPDRLDPPRVEQFDARISRGS